ncbi:hypothetical protein QS413_12610 [Staphylococcus pseudintermedius]|uniref:hypothetical protein n=1 Tax=Staphylococcus pseudintermedius TaxID=283734 RepID=UPI00286D80FE|nr:hypothetical protein [Staphylococcus pseudintermedius]WMZ50324.1 hypothetical protein QS413_12610 [Staphylococcus pseudintermedius]
MILSNSVRQRYRTDTAGKTPTEINQELRKRGVKSIKQKETIKNGQRKTKLL